MKLYVVTSGYGLEYHIDAIFMNGNKAKDYCDLVFGDYYKENNVCIEVHYTRDN